MELTQQEREVLNDLRQGRYPVARFELHSTKEESLVSAALNHVHCKGEHETMDCVKARGAALAALEEKGLVQLQYGVNCWVRGDYDLICRSDLCKLFCETAEQGARMPGALFDTPCLCRGYAVLTARGTAAASEKL